MESAKEPTVFPFLNDTHLLGLDQVENFETQYRDHSFFCSSVPLNYRKKRGEVSIGWHCIDDIAFG